MKFFILPCLHIIRIPHIPSLCPRDLYAKCLAGCTVHYIQKILNAANLLCSANLKVNGFLFAIITDADKKIKLIMEKVEENVIKVKYGTDIALFVK